MIRARHRRVAQRSGAQSSLYDPEGTVLAEEFRERCGTLRFRQLPVQLPLQLSDALPRVAQRPEPLQLIDDLLDFVVNHGKASFPGVCHKSLEAPAAAR